MATYRQRIVASKMVDSGGKISMRRAMREAGYSEAMAKNPQKLTRSTAWKDLIGEKLSDELLVDRLVVLINAKKTEKTYVKGERIIKIEKEDYSAISRGLEMAFRIKGKYIAEKEIPYDPYENMTDEELDQKIKDLESSVYAKRYRMARNSKKEPKALT